MAAKKWRMAKDEDSEPEVSDGSEGEDMSCFVCKGDAALFCNDKACEKYFCRDHFVEKHNSEATREHHIRPLLGEDLTDLSVGWLPESSKAQHAMIEEDTQKKADQAAAAEEAARQRAEEDEQRKRHHDHGDEDPHAHDSQEPDSKRAAYEEVSKPAGPPRSVFVSSIAFEAGVKEVRDFFKDCGAIVDIRMPKGTEGRRSYSLFVPRY